MSMHTIQIQHIIADIQAESDTAIHAAVVGNGTEQTINSGITQPIHARNVRLVSTGTHNGNSTVTGIDPKGNAATEVIAIVPGGAAVGSHPFISITSYTIPDTLDATDTLSLGVGSKIGLHNYINATSHVLLVKKNGSVMDASDYSVSAGYATVDLSTGAAINTGDDFEIIYKTF